MYVNQHKKNIYIYTIFFYYSIRCGHSQSLKPSLENLAEHFEKSPLNFDATGYPKVVIGRVDATVEVDLAHQYDISGYPTLLFFPKKSKEENGINLYDDRKHSEVYNGARDISTMTEWIINKAELGNNFPRYVETSSDVVTLSSIHFDSIVFDPTMTVLVMFYVPWCVHCEKFRKNYENLAHIFKDEENIVIASVNADNEKELSNRFDVNM